MVKNTPKQIFFVQICLFYTKKLHNFCLNIVLRILKTMIVSNLSEKCCVWSKKKDWFVIQICNFKTNTPHFKNFRMQLKMGSNTSTIEHMFIEQISEDPIFIVNGKQYFLRSRSKRLPKTFRLFILPVR